MRDMVFLSKVSCLGRALSLSYYSLPLSRVYQLGQMALAQTTVSTHPGRYALGYKAWNLGGIIGPPRLRHRCDQVHLKPSSYLSLVSCPAAEAIYLMYLAWKAGLPLPPAEHPAGCSDCLELGVWIWCSGMPHLHPLPLSNTSFQTQ